MGWKGLDSTGGKKMKIGGEQFRKRGVKRPQGRPEACWHSRRQGEGALERPSRLWSCQAIKK